jgi:hypothetical protein
MGTLRTQISLPGELVAAVDAVSGERGRTQFILRAIEREVNRQRQLDALDAATGAWKDEDHPALEAGAYAWVRELRQDRRSLADLE